MALNPSSSRGAAGTITSVTAADTSIVVGGTATDPTIATGTLDVIATDHPAAADWSNNSHKITSLANGSAAQDAAAFGQIPTALPPSGAAGGDLTGSTYPNPVVAAGKITVAKLAAAVTLDAIAAANATAGDVSMASHKLTNVTDPVSAQDAATKNYVDAVALGLTYKKPADLGTVAALPTNIYVNGASGVGATLTATAFGALSVDGTAVTVGQRILVKNEATQANNGIYTVTATGGGAALYVLTRATDFNQSSEIQAGDALFVDSGATLADTLWIQTTTGAITVGTTSIVFSQLGNTPSLASVLAVGNSAGSTKITNLTNGSAAQDAAAFGQIPTALPPNGSASGDLGSTYPSPTVTAIHETSGPTKLTIGTIADGQFLKRVGSTLVSALAPVTTVFGRTGDVVATGGDYTAAQVTNAADKSSGSTQTFTGEILSAGYRSSSATVTIGSAGGVGVGGAVTQTTSRSTAVTLNTPCGSITTHTASLAGSGVVEFTVNNSTVTAADAIILTMQSAPGAWAIPYQIAGVALGSFIISYMNNTGGSTTTAYVFNYTVIHGVST